MQWSRRQTWAQVQALQHSGFVTLGERLKLSGYQFLQLSDGDNNSPQLSGVVSVIRFKPLAQSLVHSRCSINGNY